MRAVAVSRGIQWSVSCVALGLGGLFGCSSLVWGAEVAELVEGFGLTPVAPPRPAADFDLPRLGGGTGSLSDFAGNWTILTFWASWCGPCRAEMPSLQHLHQTWTDRGVAVLGVSVDRTEAAAGAFVDEHELSFPQLWDADGTVAAEYKAVAIPLSYVIDPQGRIVAAAAGARDWRRMSPLMEALVDGSTGTDSAVARYADRVDLPTVSEPPTADVSLSNSAPRVGQRFSVDVRLRWSGHFDEYLPQPPKVSLPAGLIERGLTASSSSREGARMVIYHLDLEAEHAGSFALDPIELRYQPRLSPDLAVSRIQGPTVTVSPRTLAGLRPRMLAAVLGGVALVVATALAVVRHRRQAGATALDPAAGPTYESLLDRFNSARALRIQGDVPGCALALLEILEELDGPQGGAAETAALTEALRFGGHVPPPHELEHLQRRVVKRLESLRPDSDRDALQALKLKDNEENA